MCPRWMMRGRVCGPSGSPALSERSEARDGARGCAVGANSDVMARGFERGSAGNLIKRPPLQKVRSGPVASKSARRAAPRVAAGEQGGGGRYSVAHAMCARLQFTHLPTTTSSSTNPKSKHCGKPGPRPSSTPNRKQKVFWSSRTKHRTNIPTDTSCAPVCPACVPCVCPGSPRCLFTAGCPVPSEGVIGPGQCGFHF